jgi:hypothetical protein
LGGGREVGRSSPKQIWGSRMRDKKKSERKKRPRKKMRGRKKKKACEKKGPRI